MVFTRDLRVDDNPALFAAGSQGPLSCLFVMDDKFVASRRWSPRRQTFLLQCLTDLDASLKQLGACLEVVPGCWSQEVQRRAIELDATSIHVSEDYSFYAQQRLNSLETWCQDNSVVLHKHPGITVVPPEHIQPSGGGEYKVFTPYWRAWLSAPKRALVDTPTSLRGVSQQHRNCSFPSSDLSAAAPICGESHGRHHLQKWLNSELSNYVDKRDHPGMDVTSKLSPYLHFGCISPLRLVELADGIPGSESFVRQVAWRDFFAQILNAHPTASWQDYRHRGDVWSYDAQVYNSWVTGSTGFPLVDAGMRQLNAEGFMPNRVRMGTASFLVKDLHQDCRLGADYFMSQLIDGDIASNYLNWQWVAGTGTDSNPHRILNPTTQAKRFDGDGLYIKRGGPELSALPPTQTINPPLATRQEIGYPPPIVDHHHQVELFKQRRLSANPFGNTPNNSAN